MAYFSQQQQPPARQQMRAPAESAPAQGAESNQQASGKSNVFALDTQHEDNINDCQFDYYGTQLASCDSKGFLQVSSLKNDGSQQTMQTFSAHKGPIWQVSWAHPKYDSVIATCGYDQKVIVWKRDLNNNWENIVFEADLGSSVNCIAWAPWEYGLILACGTAEGRVIVFARNKDDTWAKVKDFVAHQSGVNGISWGPTTEPAILVEGGSAAQAQGGDADGAPKFQLQPKRLVTGGNDNEVHMWTLGDGDADVQMSTVGSHNDWVRDVAWCSNIGLMHEMIASCSEDSTCKVWSSRASQDGKGGVVWELKQEIKIEGVPLWKVSWSQVGNMLAVAGADNMVRIMSEDANGEWKEVQVINEETSQESNGAGAAAQLM